MATRALLVALARLCCVGVLARDNLHLARGDDLISLHFEVRVLDDECPHVV